MFMTLISFSTYLMISPLNKHQGNQTFYYPSIFWDSLWCIYIFPCFQIATKVFDIQEIFYSHVITFILLVTLLVCLRDQMNQQKIQNEQSFNNRGHRKMWMFLLLTCTYLLQISSFRNQMTQKTIYYWHYVFLSHIPPNFNGNWHFWKVMHIPFSGII